MEGIYQEYENENSLRSFPFASGCARNEDGSHSIPDWLFVDAVLYPVNSRGVLYLSGVSADGTFSVSDDSGEIMSGSPDGNRVELTDLSGLGRHVGTLLASSKDALETFAFSGKDQTFSRDEAAFSSGCVFPVEIEEVTSLDVGSSGAVLGTVGFSNESNDDIRVSSARLGDGVSSIRFDVLHRPGPVAYQSIRRVICVVDGETPFRIRKMFDRAHPENYGYNTVILSLDGLDRDAVCAARREEGLEMVDTCSCEKPPLPREERLPEAYQLEEVFIPPDPDGSEGGLPDGAENAFFLVVPNYYDENGIYYNPISITLEDGVASPDVSGEEPVVNGTSAEMPDGYLTDSVTSKGVIIQVPGLSGGNQ